MRVVTMRGAGRFFVGHDGGAGALLQRECGGNKNFLAEMYRSGSGQAHFTVEMPVRKEASTSIRLLIYTNTPIQINS
jgi:hypothetical protein